MAEQFDNSDSIDEASDFPGRIGSSPPLRPPGPNHNRYGRDQAETISSYLTQTKRGTIPERVIDPSKEYGVFGPETFGNQIRILDIDRRGLDDLNERLKLDKEKSQRELAETGVVSPDTQEHIEYINGQINNHRFYNERMTELKENMDSAARAPEQLYYLNPELFKNMPTEEFAVIAGRLELLYYHFIEATKVEYRAWEALDSIKRTIETKWGYSETEMDHRLDEIFKVQDEENNYNLTEPLKAHFRELYFEYSSKITANYDDRFDKTDREIMEVNKAIIQELNNILDADADSAKETVDAFLARYKPKPHIPEPELSTE